MVSAAALILLSKGEKRRKRSPKLLEGRQSARDYVLEARRRAAEISVRLWQP